MSEEPGMPAASEVEISASRRAWVAANIYEAIRSCFAHWEAIPDFDLHGAFQNYLDEAFVSDGRLAFDFATLRFVARLQNGHTAFSDEWLWHEYGAPLGFYAIKHHDGWKVSRTDREDIQIGKVISLIDGTPIKDFAASQMAFVPGSSTREQANRLFSRPYLFPPSFEIAFTDGKKAFVERCIEKAVGPSDEPYGRWIEPNHHFVLTIPSFANPRFEARAVEIVRSLSNDVRLTVDLRGNCGGDSPCALVSALMPQPYRFWRFATPASSALGRAEGDPPGMIVTEPSWIEAQPQAFQGPVSILVDARTLSAAEDFVLPFKDNGRAHIIGEATGGSSGQPYNCDLGDGMRLWVSAKRQYFPEGAPFEGVGIQPDAEDAEACQIALIDSAKYI